MRKGRRSVRKESWYMRGRVMRNRNNRKMGRCGAEVVMEEGTERGTMVGTAVRNDLGRN